MPRYDTQAQVVVIVAGRYGRSGLARRMHANFLPAEARACIFSTVNPLPNLAPSWDVAPTSDCAVVRRHPETGAWQPLDLLKGSAPYWTKEPPMIALTAKAARTNRFKV